MDIRKKILLGIVITSVFIFLVTVLVFVYALSSQGEAVPTIFEPFLHYHIHFMVVMGLFGVFSGIVTYNVLSATLDKQKKVINANLGIIMKFLSSEDREVINLLMQKQGMTTQSEVSRLPGMSRLKAHRVIKKLESHGLVHIEKHGKINIIHMIEELRNIR